MRDDVRVDEERRVRILPRGREEHVSTALVCDFVVDGESALRRDAVKAR